MATGSSGSVAAASLSAESPAGKTSISTVSAEAKRTVDIDEWSDDAVDRLSAVSFLELSVTDLMTVWWQGFRADLVARCAGGGGVLSGGLLAGISCLAAATG